MSKTRKMHYRIGVAFFLALVSEAAAAGSKFTIGTGTEYMSWREYDPVTDERLLEERGFRPFADVRVATPVDLQTDMVILGHAYGGYVLYDGQLMDGTPWESATQYSGFLGELGITYKTRPNAGNHGSEVVATYGIDSWRRHLRGIAGYTENYRLSFVRLGMKKDRLFGTWAVQGGVLLPLAVHESVEIYSGLNLQPKGKPSLYLDFASPFAEGMEVGFTYQGYRFDKSDPDAADTNGDGIYDAAFFQPRSSLDMYRLYLRYNF